MASPSSAQITVPERYSVVRHVANGGMASVWEAQDQLLGRSVAVKVLSPAFAADDAARRRFTREARAAARLSTHPHVVTVYDAGEHAGQAYMVMALYRGGTVADRIKAGPVPRALALAWLEDAASALDLAHGEGVVHRDVKPANLLLDGSDRVAVADFGIATAAWETSMTSTGMVLGTLAYLAPEQRTGGMATPASDRYALALVARELLTGARPGTEPAHPVAPLPGAAEVVLQRATAEDPDARPKTCGALVAELEAALGSAGTEATAATRAAPARLRAAAIPVAAPEAPTAARAASVPAREALPPAAAARSGAFEPLGPGPEGPEGPGNGRGGRGTRALVALALVALVVGVGAAVASSLGGGDDPPAREAATPTSTAKKARTSTGSSSSAKKKGSSSSSSSAPTPTAATPAPATPTQETPTPTQATPPPASTATPAPAPTTKSRATLIAQNNQAYKNTPGDPAGQVAPLQEAVSGLCTNEKDINCAFALYNLAHALRLSGRPAEAVPLLERRLAISDNQRGTVRQELALARQAAGKS